MVCISILLLLSAVTLQHLHAAAASRLPVVVFHGLGDRFDSPGLVSLADDIASGDNATYVYIARTSNDSNVDKKATLFGNMTAQLEVIANEIRKIDALRDGFNALGLSQGGLFARYYIERYNLAGHGYPVLRNLVTMGSPWVGPSGNLHLDKAPGRAG